MRKPMALTKVALATVFLAGATALAIAASAAAEPGCVNPDGSTCGISGGIPGGPDGTAGWGGASGSIPGGLSGSAWPGGATGCIPGLGCYTVGR